MRWVFVRGAVSHSASPGRMIPPALTFLVPAPYVAAPMTTRGQRRTVASVLAQALAAKPGAGSAALAAAFAEACGPNLARQVSCRGLTREGKLLVLVADPGWADQVRALEPDLLARLATRLGPRAPRGLDLRVGQGGGGA